MTFDRIEARTGVLGGKPCVRGTRLSVEFLLELFASGAARADILERFPELSEDDLSQVLQYAARAVGHEVDIAVEVRP